MYSDTDKKVRYVFLIYMYTIILHYYYSTLFFNNIIKTCYIHLYLYTKLSSTVILKVTSSGPLLYRKVNKSYRGRSCPIIIHCRYKNTTYPNQTPPNQTSPNQTFPNQTNRKIYKIRTQAGPKMKTV